LSEPEHDETVGLQPVPFEDLNEARTMKRQRKKRLNLKRRQMRVRRRISGTSDRPRLTVCRSLAHISAQLVDDATGKTLATASTRQARLKDNLTSTGNIEAAKAVGKEIASLALSRGINKICFDRGGRKYHGRVRALAEAARQAGLEF